MVDLNSSYHQFKRRKVRERWYAYRALCLVGWLAFGLVVLKMVLVGYGWTGFFGGLCWFISITAFHTLIDETFDIKDHQLYPKEDYDAAIGEG